VKSGVETTKHTNDTKIEGVGEKAGFAEREPFDSTPFHSVSFVIFVV